ncbi:hypothetical protein F53441_4823 [Fusarium austroafricanum]|uniref:BHLH domain-containing protein n=1 Tax=Fusarium austroafricanum TaxID=2364996 RepID=A0A8H4KJA6_9HYPO|nr:hypothetical protein F53441_4823 [Fusarium austroafricanum]
MTYQPTPNTYLSYAHHDASNIAPQTGGLLTPTGQQSQTPNQTASFSYPACQVQLRSASRKSKNRRRRPAGVQSHALECHNLNEKQYRTRLKSQFEGLLAVLPAASTLSLANRYSQVNFGQVLSRGQVLDLARDRILELEEKIEYLELELEDRWAS